MAGVSRRERNGRWTGGRYVEKRGYVLLNVGIGHPLADVRGLAYEHRVVASKEIGRWLTRRDQVHHIDGNRGNNDPSNLEVLTPSEHRRIHAFYAPRRVYKRDENGRFVSA